MVDIGVIGCAGRMGRTIAQEILSSYGAKLVSGSEPKGSPFVGEDVGTLLHREKLGVRVTDNNEFVVKMSDVIIDFTRPETTLALNTLAVKHGVAHVIGTTGLSDAQKKQLAANGRTIPIVLAPNMSVGVNLLLSLIEKAAQVLDSSYDIEIVEMHHRHKVDAPSGTALAFGEAAARGRKVTLDDTARHAREGQVGARPEGEIGFATLRGGDVVGDHTVLFAGDGERIEISHKASDRKIFAKGAVRAALWLVGQKPGLYTMRDVLGLK